MTANDRRFEEYKLFLENTHSLSERRQRAAQTFLAVNTAIFGVFALLVKDSGFTGWKLLVASVPLFVLGVTTDLLWHQVIERFWRLIDWRYQQLRMMEGSLGEQESFMILSKEYAEYYKTSSQRGFSFSGIEIWMPRLFIMLYLSYAAGLIVAVASGWL
jgi:hypothetical protein